MGWEKLLKCHMKGKASKKLANGQNIDYSEKRKRPKGFICPCTGVKYHNIQPCLLVYAADSGERLQDHRSSGLFFLFLVKNDSLGNFDFVWQCHLDYSSDLEGLDQERQLVQITLMDYK